MQKEKMKLTKVNKYSYGVVIPKDFVKKLRWKEKQNVTVEMKGKSIIIKDWKPASRKGGE